MAFAARGGSCIVILIKVSVLVLCALADSICVCIEGCLGFVEAYFCSELMEEWRPRRPRKVSFSGSCAASEERGFRL